MRRDLYKRTKQKKTVIQTLTTHEIINKDDNLFNMLPLEIFKLILSFLNKEHLAICQQVATLWRDTINEEYSKSAYGKMLRFVRFASQPITNAINDIDRLKKDISFSPIRHTANQPLSCLPLIHGLILLTFFIYIFIDRYRYDQETAGRSWRFANSPAEQSLLNIQKGFERIGIPKKLAQLYLNPKTALIIGFIFLIGYLLYLQYKAYRHPHQTTANNPDVLNKLTDYFRKHGDIINLFYNTPLNYTNIINTIQNNPITIMSIMQDIDGNKNKLLILKKQMDDYTKTLMFNPLRTISIKRISNNNINFENYLRDKLILWNSLHQSRPDFVLELNQDEKKLISRPLTT